MYTKRVGGFTVVISMVVVLFGGTVHGQEYPARPVRIVTAGVGTSVDIMSRLVSQGVSPSLGQPIILENRGGGSLIAGAIVAKALPDGHTLLGASNSFWVAPLLQVAPYDPVRDFAPVSLIARAPTVLVVNPSIPVKSVKELIAMAKAKPGQLNYSSGTSGGTSHLVAELFKGMAGLNIVRVPYTASGAALNAVISGEVQLAFDSAPVVMSQVQSGKVRALAVVAAQPSPLVPGVPTAAESGLPGFVSGSLIVGIFAPVNTPASVINRLNQEIVRFVTQPGTKEKFVGLGVEAAGSSPDELAAALKSEVASLGKVIRDAGIKTN